MTDIYERQRLRNTKIENRLNEKKDSILSKIREGLYDNHNLGIAGDYIYTVGWADAAQTNRHYIGLQWTYEDGSGSQWRRVLNGKMRLYVGDYGDKKCFRLRKDGTMRIDAIVEELARVHAGRIARQSREAELNDQRCTVNSTRKLLCKKHGVSEHASDGLNVTSQGRLRFSVAGLDARQAEELLSLAIMIGAIKVDCE